MVKQLAVALDVDVLGDGCCFLMSMLKLRVAAWRPRSYSEHNRTIAQYDNSSEVSAY